MFSFIICRDLEELPSRTKHVDVISRVTKASPSLKIHASTSNVELVYVDHKIAYAKSTVDNKHLAPDHDRAGREVGR